MPNVVDIVFARTVKPGDGLAVLVAAGGAKFGPSAADADPGNVIDKAAKVSSFTGKALTTLDLIAPSASSFDRILAVGLGEPQAINEQFWLRLGGTIQSHLRKSAKVAIYLDAPGFEIGANRSGRRGAWHAPAWLPFRQVPHQEGRCRERRGSGQGQGHVRYRGSDRRQEGVRRGRGRCRRRHAGARSGQ